MVKNCYPTKQEINMLKHWDATDFWGLIDFLEKRWTYCQHIRKNGLYVHFSTYGWSGNEDLVDAINPIWMSMYHYMWRTGGHYIFKARSAREKENIKRT